MASNDFRKVQELAEKIIEHKRYYYSGRPLISDAAYDRMEDELRSLDPEHPALIFVGSDVEMHQQKAEHQTPMLSLDKTYSFEDLLSWKKDHDIVSCYKIDGNSLSLIYENGQLKLSKTRGNGRIGEVVTEKIKWVDAIPKTLGIKEDVEVRGELYCTESSFVRLAKVMVEMGLEQPVSPRNIVAGLLGRKNFHHLCQFFCFYAFEWISNSDSALGITTEIEKLEKLRGLGFEVPGPKLLRTEADIRENLESIRSMMEEDEIPMDGAVFVYNDLRLHRELGETSHHPRFKLSFKWQGETATAKLKQINWSTSRLGIVTPVAEIEPVFLSGARITNITLHNAAHLKLFNLKPGDEIEIVRSGEVIPKFLRVVHSAKGEAKLIDLCPSCGAQLSNDGVRMLCLEKNFCPAQKSGMILNWIKACNIEDISDKRLDQMIQAGLVHSIPDLYRLSKEQLLTLPATKDRMAEKILKRIHDAKHPKAPAFLNGLGIGGMGETSWEKLLERFGSWEKLFTLEVADIEAVDGFAEKSAKQVFEGLKASVPLVDELKSLGVVPVDDPKILNLNGPFVGMLFVITGELSEPRKDVEAKIKAAGGKLSSSVSKKINAIVTNDPHSNSSKMKEARKLEIPIWSEEKLWIEMQKEQKL